jgi:putative hydrolase of HD superfamily
MLKDLTRSGYAFLGSGRESVAEHSFTMAFICFVMAQMDPDVDGGRLVAMALVHDIPEARTGDLNYVQKKYARADEAKAVSHLTAPLPFGEKIQSLIQEFNRGETTEARLANDADQLSFILELKKLNDTGAAAPAQWLPIVIDRLKTPVGKEMAEKIMETRWDGWWMDGYCE